MLPHPSWALQGCGPRPMRCGSHMSPREVSLPPLSFFLATKLNQKALPRVLAVLELEFFDLLAQPISVAET